MKDTTRRGLLGAIAVAPAVLAATPVGATGNSADPVWVRLVADFQTKYAAWLATVDLEEEADEVFHDVRASLPPEPVRPGSISENDILDRTVRELRDECRTPEHKAAWATYERDHGAWQKQCDALREQVVGPAKAAYERASELRIEAFNALIEYRVQSLHDLRKKMELIAEYYEGFEVPFDDFANLIADVRNLGGEA